jgi:hypothetical protein
VIISRPGFGRRTITAGLIPAGDPERRFTDTIVALTRGRAARNGASGICRFSGQTSSFGAYRTPARAQPHGARAWASSRFHRLPIPNSFPSSGNHGSPEILSDPDLPGFRLGGIQTLKLPGLWRASLFVLALKSVMQRGV